MLQQKKPAILLIYTGGTIGMQQDSNSHALKPLNFSALKKHIPELEKLNVTLSSISFKTPIDSSNASIEFIQELAALIEKNYNIYNGFVVLHGSDTMAYTASALSFMFENLSKPIIFTGSQLPIGVIRTDGKENIISAIEITATQRNGKPIINEVCIYFEYKLYRGNRTYKYNSANFDAFKSPNYPFLAEAGVDIKYHTDFFLNPSKKKLQINKLLNNHIACLKLYPGINETVVKSILFTPNIKAVVLETFGSGNAITKPWFINLLKEAITKRIIILNITQCNEGFVIQGKYETSSQLKAIGVISGHDMTFESAITKLMVVLGKNLSHQKTVQLLHTVIAGEMTLYNKLN